MKKIAKAFSGLILIAALFVLGNSLVITYPDEYMIVRQFGEIVRVVETPGVSVKIPFVQTSAPIPKALQIYDIPKSDVITKDKKSMIADAFVLWKISDPVLFTRHLNGQVAQAQSRIAASVFSSMKSVISNMDQTEIIENRDGKLADRHFQRSDQCQAQSQSALRPEPGVRAGREDAADLRHCKPLLHAADARRAI